MKWINPKNKLPESINGIGSPNCIMKVVSHGHEVIDHGYYNHDRHQWCSFAAGDLSDDVLGWMYEPDLEYGYEKPPEEKVERVVNVELKSCPFCQSDARTKDIPYQNSDGDLYWVGCGNKKCFMHDNLVCRSLWNERVDDIQHQLGVSRKDNRVILEVNGVSITLTEGMTHSLSKALDRFVIEMQASL